MVTDTRAHWRALTHQAGLGRGALASLPEATRTYWEARSQPAAPEKMTRAMPAAPEKVTRVMPAAPPTSKTGAWSPPPGVAWVMRHGAPAVDWGQQPLGIVAPSIIAATVGMSRSAVLCIHRHRRIAPADEPPEWHEAQSNHTRRMERKAVARRAADMRRRAEAKTRADKDGEQ